jgi:putative ABC transport system ATP-binding protein
VSGARIELRALRHAYDGTEVLRGVDLDVPPGEHLAVLGPSGSGKSTLVLCAAGVLVPTAGEVWVDDVRVDRLGEDVRSRLRLERFGFVFQAGHLLTELPAVENVALPLVLAGWPRRRALAEAAGWFAPLGLAGLEDRRPGQLSGGQAQRVAVARALVTRPRTVVADEPTGALDRHTGQEVMGVLMASAASVGATVLVVTHDPAVAAWCERRIEIVDGGLASDHRLDHAAPGGPLPVGASAP